MNRPLPRRARAAVAVAVAAGLFALAASITTTYNGQNAGLVIGPPGCFLGIEWRGDPGPFASCTGSDPDAPQPARRAAVDTVAAFNAGWTAGVADLGDGRAPTSPNVPADSTDPGAVAWMDGWVDGQADALGDDNRDGRVEEDESGWDCRTMGNRVCGPERTRMGG
ncbi:hypothetical protein ABZ352_18795 [Streptomyces griseofuscus]|uniref:hypothetical protein n=1 Tax=Streptomyces griseofuscus TaxID=146922 RepID=UPI00340750AE